MGDILFPDWSPAVGDLYEFKGPFSPSREQVERRPRYSDPIPDAAKMKFSMSLLLMAAAAQAHCK